MAGQLIQIKESSMAKCRGSAVAKGDMDYQILGVIDDVGLQNLIRE